MPVRSPPALGSPADFANQRGKDQSYPHSLRWLLSAIRVKYHDQPDRKVFASILNSLGRPYGRGNRTKLSNTKIQKLEQLGGTPPLYSHLEKYAHSVQVPTSLLLLFSLLIARKRDGETMKIKQMKRALKEILDGVNETSEFDMAELRRWSSIYCRHEPSLFEAGTPLLSYKKKATQTDD